MRLFSGLTASLKDAMQELTQTKQGERGRDVCPLPWEAFGDEELANRVKEGVLRISEDAGFLEGEVDPQYRECFKLEEKCKLAELILGEDQRLGLLRNQVVPLKFEDGDFWILYFFRMESIVRSIGIENSLATESKKSSIIKVAGPKLKEKQLQSKKALNVKESSTSSSHSGEDSESYESDSIEVEVDLENEDPQDEDGI